jgi:four helix bundle protein
MDPNTMKARTREFALRSIRLVDALPLHMSAQVMGKQLLRAASSVGANYRAACRAKSGPDFLSKLKIVEEEIDESAYWLDLLVGSGIVAAQKLQPLQKEADELTAIIVATIRTARANQSNPAKNRKS